MKTWKVVLTLALSAAAGGLLEAQTIDFAIAQDGVFVPVSAGSSITLQTPAVNARVSVHLRVRNTGVTPLSIRSLVASNPAFVVSGPTAPFSLATGANFMVELSYQSASGARILGEFQVTFQDLVSGATRLDRLGLIGVAPEFRFSYISAADGNQVPVTSGNTIPFAPVTAGASSAVTVVTANIGSGPGVLDAVTISGAAFRVSGLPLLPITIASGTEFRFGTIFSSTTAGDFNGTLDVRSEAGSLNVALSGRSLSPSLTYELTLPDRTIPMVPGQPVVLPETGVGTSVTSAVRVLNSGTSAGSIAIISVTGLSYALSDVPLLPAPLAPEGALQFTLTATPREPGRNAGTLRIGNDTFPLEIAGTGARLSYRYTIAGVETPVTPGATIPFPQTQVGSRNDIRFRIGNVGNRDALMTVLSVVQTGNSYSLAGVPALPATLAPGQTLEFDVQFTARALGTQAASLQINTDSISLTGIGAPPPPLPGVTYSGVSGEVQPMQQPTLGLALNQPYPVALRGQLQLRFESSSFADDPSMQFATGGRLVDFQIPAGTLDAIFPNGTNRIRFQTGTVAGNISIVPAFAIDTFPITDNLPNPLRLTLPASAPQLLSVQIAAAAPGTISFFVTGATTPRSLRSIEFTFEPTESYRNSLSAGTIVLNVESQADTYFRSAGSTGFGGLFTGTIPFALSDGGSTPLQPGLVLQSVTVTIVNAIGRSNTVSLPLR